MRIRHFLALLLAVDVSVHAQTPECTERESKLKAEIGVANGCARQQQICMDAGPTNPMRELNYCQNLLKRCESLDGSIQSEELRRKVGEFRRQCP